MSDSNSNTGHSYSHNKHREIENRLERRRVKQWLECEQWDDLPCPKRSVYRPRHYYDRKNDTPSWREHPYSKSPGRASIHEFRARVMPKGAHSVIFFEGEPWWYGTVGHELKVYHYKLAPHLDLQSKLVRSHPIRGLMHPLCQKEIDIYFRLWSQDRKRVTYTGQSRHYVLHREHERLHIPLTPAQKRRERKNKIRARRRWVKELVLIRERRLTEALDDTETSPEKLDELREQLAFAKRVSARWLKMAA